MGERGLHAGLAMFGVVALAWFTYELTLRRRVAVTAAVLAAATPLLWVQSATLLAYHPSMMFVAAAAAFLLRSFRSGADGSIFLAGAIATLGLLLRPFDAVLILLPVGLLAVSRSSVDERRGGTVERLLRPVASRRSAVLALGALVSMTVWAVYNTAVTGDPWRMTFNQMGGFDSFGFGRRASTVPADFPVESVDRFSPADGWSATVDTLSVFPSLLTGAPVLLAVAVVALVARFARSDVKLLAALVALPIGGYFFWWGTENYVNFELHRAIGPGYHYVLLVGTVPLAAIGLTEFLGSRRSGLLVALGVVLWLPVNVAALRDVDQRNEARSAEHALIAVPGPALVLEPPEFENDLYSNFANPPDLDGDVLVALDRPDRRWALHDRFPDRTLYQLRAQWPPNGLFTQMSSTIERLSIERSSTGFDVTVRGEPASPAFLQIDDAAASGVAVPSEPPTTWGVVSPAGTVTFTVTLDGLGDDAGLLLRAGVGEETDLGFRVTHGCTFPARRSESHVEMLVPCQPFQLYHFPNGSSGRANEDVAAVVRVVVAPAADGGP